MRDTVDMFEGVEHSECEDCGEISAEVSHVNCPYAEEIHHKRIPAVLCNECYVQRCMDI